MSDLPPVCDYEGSNYRTRFWESQGRDYEDRVERIALRRLLPPSGGTLIDIGAGFGRLATEFDGYDRVVLFDYSRSLLQDAQKRLRDDPRFIYVAGNWYSMPFVSGLFDTLVQVRTIHHAADVTGLFGQLAHILRPRGVFVLEFANKHNLKAILRYWSGKQQWSPFSPHPVEFVELNYDFHPRWMERQLEASGFKVRRILTVSHFRLPVIKRVVPASLLAWLDSMAQLSGGWFQLAPSIFVYADGPDKGDSAEQGSFFACPDCRTPLGEPDAGRLVCPNNECRHQWSFEDNIYDFKNRLT
ncbi:MAG: class I SAM-dependent methyltransferase [Candidatus Promineifilaceae bacterium]